MARPGLRCSMRTSQLRHACGIQFPDQGSNPGPLHWEHGVLPIGPPGRSLKLILDQENSPSFVAQRTKFLRIKSECVREDIWTGELLLSFSLFPSLLLDGFLLDPREQNSTLRRLQLPVIKSQESTASLWSYLPKTTPIKKRQMEEIQMISKMKHVFCHNMSLSSCFYQQP